jgi:hypothetical protein
MAGNVLGKMLGEQPAFEIGRTAGGVISTVSRLPL